MLIFQGVGGGLIFVYPLVGETYNPITYLLSGGISFVFLFGWESLLNMTQHFFRSLGMMFITSTKGHILRGSGYLVTGYM